MNDERQVFKAGLALAMSLVLSSVIGAWAFVHVKNSNQTIIVTGSARKRIRSDLVIWRVAVTGNAAQLSDAYQQVSRNVPKVRDYLVAKGVPENQIVISSIFSRTMREKTQGYAAEDAKDVGTGRIVGYSLRQEVQVRSNDVDKVTAVSRGVTELMNQGILLESAPPEYIYTKLGDLKVQMLAEAAADAKQRAQQIASSTGNGIGALRGAEMGVIQVTPADSYEVSGEGVNDTTSLDKDITAVVHMTFGID